MLKRKPTETETKRKDLYKELRHQLAKGGKGSLVAKKRLQKEFNLRVYSPQEIENFTEN